MGSPVSVRVEGLNQKIKELQALGLEVEDLKDAFAPIAKEGAEVAAGFVQSRSGALAGTARGNRAKNKAVVTVGRASVPYAGPQNYGWARRNIPAQGFFEKTDQVMEPVALKRLEDEIDSITTKRGLS
jgi:hypothetical protein